MWNQATYCIIPPPMSFWFDWVKLTWWSKSITGEKTLFQRWPALQGGTMTSFGGGTKCIVFNLIAEYLSEICLCLEKFTASFFRYVGMFLLPCFPAPIGWVQDQENADFLEESESSFRFPWAAEKWGDEELRDGEGKKVDQGEVLVGRIKGIFRTRVPLILRYLLGISIPHIHCST